MTQIRKTQAKINYFKAWEKSGNFTLSHGKFTSLEEGAKSEISNKYGVVHLLWLSLWWKTVILSLLVLTMYTVHNSWPIPIQYILPSVIQVEVGLWMKSWMLTLERKPRVVHESKKTSSASLSSFSSTCNCFELYRLSRFLKFLGKHFRLPVI